MSCGAQMRQTVPCGPYGADARSVPSTCGSTGIDGRELQCAACAADGPPWYICRHGRDTSERQCDACEFED